MKFAAFFAISTLLSLSEAYVPAKRDDFTNCLTDAKVPFETKDSPDWAQEVKPYNLRIPYVPVAVVTATSPAQVKAAVSCAAKHNVKVSAKGGGHSYANFGYGGENGHLVIVLDQLYGVSLNKKTNMATIQPGARLGHVATELFKQGGRAIAHGSCPGVGVAGHSLHGGYGFASRTYGLALDWMAGANVVLANGTGVHVSKTQHADLFWALRGAGSSFGIVTQFYFNTFAAPKQATYFTINLEWDKQKAVDRMLAFQDFGAQAPKELNMRVIFGPNSQGFDGVYYGDEAGLQKTLKPFLDKTGAQISDSGTVGWVESLEHNAGADALDQTTQYDSHATFYATSLAVKALTKAQVQSFVNAISANGNDANARHSWYILVDLQGGAVSTLKNSDTSYGHRDKLFLFQIYDNQESGEYPKSGLALMKGIRESISKNLADGDWGMYINYPDTEIDGKTAQKLYWGSNIGRLQQIKAAFDPKNVFSYPQGVTPAQ